MECGGHDDGHTDERTRGRTATTATTQCPGRPARSTAVPAPAPAPKQRDCEYLARRSHPRDRTVRCGRSSPPTRRNSPIPEHPRPRPLILRSLTIDHRRPRWSPQPSPARSKTTSLGAATAFRSPRRPRLSPQPSPRRLGRQARRVGNSTRERTSRNDGHTLLRHSWGDHTTSTPEQWRAPGTASAAPDETVVSRSPGVESHTSRTRHSYPPDRTDRCERSSQASR